jgi:hypothetical protein
MESIDDTLSKKLIGNWSFEDKTAIITLKENDSCLLYNRPASLFINGKWRIVNFGDEEQIKKILVIENTGGDPNSYMRNDEYFKYYLFSIDSLSSNELWMTDLSNEMDIRRNRQFKFTKTF